MFKKATLFIIFIISTLISTHAQEFENGEIGITLNDYGRVRLHAPAIGATVQLDRFSFLAGIERDRVFDYKNDSETVDTARNIDTDLSDVAMTVSVNNTYPLTLDPPGIVNPPAFDLTVTVYGWNSGGFAVVKYEFVNKESDNMETTFGFEVLPQIDGAYGLESVEYNTGRGIVQLQQSAFSTKVGFKVLSEDIQTLTIVDWFDSYELGDTLLWDWLTAGTITSSFSSGSDGSVDILGLAPKTVSLDETTEVWVAIAVGATEGEMFDNISAAVEKYTTITDVKREDGLLPQNYSLQQNYPNPFNPSTKISFSIPKETNVSLKVFNAVGQEVRNILNETLRPGNYSVDFNAQKLSSGIYFYKIVTSDFVSTKKMMLKD
jgi:hypothetical protein